MTDRGLAAPLTTAARAVSSMTALRAKPFAGSAASTGPDKPGLRADEFVTTNGNRWSAPGEPTIYLGSDPGVAIAEQGRHWAERGSTVALWTVEL